MSRIQEALERASKVKPYAEKNGIKIVGMEDMEALIEKHIIDKEPDIGERLVNPDGTIARSLTRFAGINLERELDNRYVKHGKRVEVIIDKRALSEQTLGRIYAKRITAYVITRNEDGILELIETKTVSDDEFLKEFTHKLDKESMLEVLEAIARGQRDLTVDKLTI